MVGQMHGGLTYGWTDIWLDRCTVGWMYSWKDIGWDSHMVGRMDGQLDRQTYNLMDGFGWTDLIYSWTDRRIIGRKEVQLHGRTDNGRLNRRT